ADSLRVGLGVSSNRINTIPGYSPQLFVDYQNQIGHRTEHSWTGTLGWNHDTRNGYWAPTRGGLLSASLNGALPGSTVKYWKFFAEASHYWPIGKGFVLYLDSQVGYGEAYGKNGITDDQFEALKVATNRPDMADLRNAFPFWQNFYSGGVRDVRGFQDNTLGPRACAGTTATKNPDGTCSGSYYTYAQPIGGAFKLLGTAQVFLPLPFLKDVNTARVS
ncbi:MAG: BamA/TamA family outer membrane protein, partial [Rhodanobacter sp.]